ncbi:MAG: hypothetical protein K0R67_2908, partial [Paenibacillus sp.]|nr:hypothetical protein [Paenibacillus sp.]
MGSIGLKRSNKARITAVLLLVMTLLYPNGWIPNESAAVAAQASSLSVYEDALSSDFVNYSWADVDDSSTAQVRSGSRALRLDPDGGKALYFYKDRIMNADEYESFSFWIHGGSTGGQKLKLVLSLGGQTVAERQVESLIPGGVPAGKWAEVKVNLKDLGIQGLLDGIWLWGDGEQESVYIDDMIFNAGTGTGTGTGDPQGQQQTVTALTFVETDLTVREGSTRAATLKAQLANGTLIDPPASLNVQWSSADESIATVASTGAVKGNKSGSTVIRAVYESFAAQLPVQVTARGASSSGPIEEIDGLYVFDDEVQEGFANYSWAQHSVNEEDTVHTGSQSISFAPRNDDGLYFYSGRIITAKEFEKLQLWVHGGDQGGQQVKLVFMAGGQPVKELALGSLIPDGIPAGAWAKVELMLADLNLPGQLFDGLLIAGTTSGQQEALYLDDIAVIRKYVAPPTVLEVRMDRPQLVLLPNESQRLEAETFLSTGATKVVSSDAVWKSDKPEVARVDKGALVAVAPGIARITADYKSHTAVAYVQVTEVAPIAVYTDGLASGFRNYSWHEKDLANTEQTHSGAYAVKFEPDGWDGVWFSGETKRSVSDYYGIEFWIHGGTTGGQKMMLHAYNGNTAQGGVDINQYAPGGVIPAGQWTRIVVNFADLGLFDENFDGMIFQASTEDNQAAVYIDDVSFLRNLNAGQLPEPQLPSVQVSVNKQADRRAINPDIYGINFDDMHTTESELPFPVQRWGCNNTTRYNWELDAANLASDWYFMNFPYEE